MVSVRADPARWEKEIRALEARVQAAAPGPGAVVLYGSSSFRIWTNVAAAFPSQRIVNLGFGGSTYSDLADFFDRLVPPLAPRVILLYGGDNDLAAGASPEKVVADFRRVYAKARASVPRARIAIVAVKPSPSRAKLLGAQFETNRRLRRFARWHRQVDFVDLATPLLDRKGEPDAAFFQVDRLHLNASGYDIWKKELGPYLERVAR